MELLAGLAPATCWLRISCSTNWATLAFLFVLRRAGRSFPLAGKAYHSTVSLARQHFSLNSFAVFRNNTDCIPFDFFRHFFRDFADFENRSSVPTRGGKSLFSRFFALRLARLFREIFDGAALFVEIISGHNVADNFRLQTVIHTFHMVFHIEFFLYFQCFERFLPFFPPPEKRIFASARGRILFT